MTRALSASDKAGRRACRRKVTTSLFREMSAEDDAAFADAVVLEEDDAAAFVADAWADVA